MVNKGDIHPQSLLLAGPSPEAELLSHISVDCVILGFENEQLKVLLIQHNGGPKDSEWALPGDFVHKDHSLSSMPYAVLERLTGIKDIFVNQLGAFGCTNRVDYRRIVTIAYYALISPQKYTLKIGSGAKDADWFKVDEVPDLIFDHKEILDFAIQRIRKDIDHIPISFELLPETFTLTQMQKVYEAILDEKLDTRNFRRKILKSGMLSDTGKIDSSVPYRAPKLYRYKKNESVKKNNSLLI